MAKKANVVPKKAPVVVKKSVPVIDAISLRKKSEDSHHTALANILAKCDEAAAKGYIMLKVDPLSDSLTQALRDVGITVNDQLVFAQGEVRISW